MKAECGGHFSYFHCGMFNDPRPIRSLLDAILMSAREYPIRGVEN